jgi:hypothetical protein
MEEELSDVPTMRLRVIKKQFDFQKARLRRGLAKNHCKINVLAALTDQSVWRSWPSLERA